MIIWLKFKRQCVRTNDQLQIKYPNIPTTTDCSVNNVEKDTQTDFYEIQSYIQEDEDDDLESNYKNDYDLKKQKLFDNDLVEYTEIEFENPELSEFIDHTYTEVEGTPKRNIFKINMEGIENDDDDEEDDEDGVCGKIDEHTDIEVYSLLHLNGEDDAVEVNESSEFYNIDENDEVEMLLVSDDNEASVQTDLDLPSDDKSQTSDLQNLNSTNQSQSESYEVKKGKNKRRKVEQKSDDVQEVNCLSIAF